MNERTPPPLYQQIERQLGYNLHWLLQLRWIAGGSVILATFLVQRLPGLSLSASPLYLIGGLILLYNTALWRWLRCARCAPGEMTTRTQQLARLQIALDWAAITALSHFSGGIQSPLIFYFIFHVVLSAILLEAREVYIFAGLASLLVGGMALAEYLGVLPHVPVRGYLDVPAYRSFFYVLGRLAFLISTMFVVAYLTIGTTRRLQEREAEVLALSEDLRSAYQRQRTLYESAQAVTSTLDLQEVLDQLTRSTTEAMGVKACAIQLLDESGTSLDTISLYGLGQADLRQCNVGLDCAPLIGDVLSGQIVTIDDVARDTRLEQRETILEQGVQATLTVPIPGKEGPLGLMRVYSETPNAFDEEDEEFLATIASHGGIAIQNAMAYEAVRKLDAAKRKFILMVTHELRSPMGVVRSLLRTLDGGYAGELNTVQREMIHRALRRADFLQTLIDDLLDLAAGKTGLRAEEKRAPVDLTEIVKRVAERYSSPAAEQGVTMRVEMASEAPLRVEGTEDNFDRVVTNLISNAVKYTPEGGAVDVRLEKEGGTARLTVADTGIGIPKEAQAHLFEEFYRAPNAKAAVQHGTGLGLVITRDIVTRYGGQIEVESTEGEGTTFVVVLPLTTAST
ncbi:MAG: sensor histidine kinase [Anaerolineae bacterium]